MGLDLYLAAPLPDDPAERDTEGGDDGEERQVGEHVASISYSGFMRVRRLLAALEGIDLDAMDGYAGWTAEGQRIAPAAQSWDNTTTTLRPLLDHSDCEGTLSSDECAAMLPRLREVRSALDYLSDHGLPEFMDKMIGGVARCAEDGLPLIFA